MAEILRKGPVKDCDCPKCQSLIRFTTADVKEDSVHGSFYVNCPNCLMVIPLSYKDPIVTCGDFE